MIIKIGMKNLINISRNTKDTMTNKENIVTMVMDITMIIIKLIRAGPMGPVRAIARGLRATSPAVVPLSAWEWQ